MNPCLAKEGTVQAQLWQHFEWAGHQHLPHPTLWLQYFQLLFSVFSLAHKFLLMQFLGIDMSTGGLTSSQMLFPGHTSEKRSTQTTSWAHSCWGHIHLGEDCGTLRNIRQQIFLVNCCALARLDKPWKCIQRRMQCLAHDEENTGFWVHPQHALN